MWSGLAPGRSVPPELAEVERANASLRVLLVEERRRIRRELRGVRRAWEVADARAQSFEQEALRLKCSESALLQEVSSADLTTSWWRERYAASQRESEEKQVVLQGYGNRIEALTQEVERSSLQVRELTTAISLHEVGRDHQRRRIAEKEELLQASHACL